MRNKILKILSMLLVIIITIAVASAVDSPAQITQTGLNTVDWSGQGITSIDTGDACTSKEPDGYAPNQPYLLWVMTSDGLTLDPNQATLNLGGSGTGTFTMLPKLQDGQPLKVVTGYFDPTTLTANATFNVTSLGSGNNDNNIVNLVISHGCSGETKIPEFSTLALPIAAVLGLVFFFQHRKNKKE